MRILDDAEPLGVGLLIAFLAVVLCFTVGVMVDNQNHNNQVMQCIRSGGQSENVRVNDDGDIGWQCLRH